MVAMWSPQRHHLSWTGAASRLLHRQNVPRHLRPHTASDGGLPWPCCAVSITLLQARCCTSSTTLLSLLSAPSDLGEEERCFEPKLNGGRIRAAAVALLGGVLRVHMCLKAFKILSDAPNAHGAVLACGFVRAATVSSGHQRFRRETRGVAQSDESGVAARIT